MNILKILVCGLVLLPLSSCSYFWFSAYPKEVERHSDGPYSIVAYASPSSFLFPSLLFGSIMDNTTIEVALVRNDIELVRSELVAWGDMQQDHLPLRVSWASQSVTVTEPKYGRSLVLSFSLDGI